MEHFTQDTVSLVGNVSTGGISLVIISLASIVAMILLDLFYRRLAFGKIELITVDIIIFSCVHTIYQFIGVYLLQHETIWHGSWTWVLVAKVIALLSFFLTAITLHNDIRKLQDQAILKYCDKLQLKYCKQLQQDCIEKGSRRHLEVVCLIREIGQNWIRPDLWQSKIFGKFFGSKEAERKAIIELSKFILPDGELSPDDLLIPDSSRKVYKFLTAILTVLSIIVACVPV